MRAWITFVLLWMALAAQGQGLRLESGGISYNNARDTGLAHLYAVNDTDEDITIRSIKYRDIELPADLRQCRTVYWYTVSHPTVTPGGMSRVLIKPVDMTRYPVNITIVHDKGELTHTVYPDSGPLTIEFIALDSENKGLWVYLRNSGPESLKAPEILVNNVKSATARPLLEIPAGITAVQCLPTATCHPGERVFVTVRAADMPSVSAMVKLENQLRIGSELQSTFCRKYPCGEEDLKDVTYLQILDCPMHTCGSRVFSAAECIKRIQETKKLKPGLTAFIYLCRNSLIDALNIYGAITDLVRINPQNRIGGSETEQEQAVNFVEYLTGMGRKACAPGPVHTVIPVRPNHPVLACPPTPEEIRLMVYMALAHGSKGIFFRDRGDAYDAFEGSRAGQVLSPDYIEKTDKTVQELTRTIEALSPLLYNSIPLSMTHDRESRIETAVLQSGDRHLVVFVLNHDNTSRLEDIQSTNTVAAEFKPKQDVQVKFNIPEGLAVKGITSPDDADTADVQFTVKGNDVEVLLSALTAGRMLCVELTEAVIAAQE